MQIEATGQVRTEATIENLQDLWDVKQGVLAPHQVGRVIVSDAVVDTDTTMLCLPTRMIRQLGLQPGQLRHIRSSGTAEGRVYGVVRLTIQGRDCTEEVMELPDDGPVVIGRIPLLQLDLVSDSMHQELIANPAHGGEHIIEAY